MRRLGTILICLAAVGRGGSGLEPRVPIAPPEDGTARSKADAVVASVHSWLAGTPVRHEALDFVPLHARTPGEGRRTAAAAPAWLPEKAERSEPARGTLLLRPAGKRPVLVIPGRIWSIDGGALCSTESALLSPGAPGFVRVARLPGGARGGGGFAGAGVTAALLLEPAGAAPRSPAAPVASTDLFRDCERATRHFERSGDGTLVGCVALVGGEPVAIYAFGDATLFAEARRDFVALAVGAAKAREAAGYPESLLRERAARARPRARSVALLRAICRGPHRMRGVPGGGSRWDATSRTAEHVAHALVDRAGRLVFFGSWRIAPAPAAKTVAPSPPAPDDPEEDLKRTRERRAKLQRKPAPRLPPLLPGG